ncbi:MAG TPA: EFR1 family ferrodoxin [Clostridia bacterium]|nr:EFR1 family ferrodoxin [Clostridia bacterium]
MSGTGNSFRVGAWMKEAAERKNISAELEQICSGQAKVKAENQKNSLLGLAFPTHGFTAPWYMIRNTLLLPFGKGRHAFVVATKGALMIDSAPFSGFEGSAAYLIAFLLMIKGYEIRGVMGLDMPANMLSVHSGLTIEDSRMIIGQAREKADDFINCILNGEKALFGVFDLLLGLILLPLSLIYLLFVRFFLAKLFFASGRCTGCGLCAKSCPKKAIKMIGRKKPRPYWKLTCESCMRCMGYCPNSAIEASHLFAGILIVLIAVQLPYHFLNDPMVMLKLDICYPVFKAIIEYLCYLFTVSFAYLLFSHLIRIPIINKLFANITCTRYYRRYHEPDTELGDLSGNIK